MDGGVGEFTAQVRFEDTETHKALVATNVVITDVDKAAQLVIDGLDPKGAEFTGEQAGFVNGTGGVWVKKGAVGDSSTGATTLTATATYKGIEYKATQSFKSSLVIKPEAFALSVKTNLLVTFNGLYNALEKITLSGTAGNHKITETPLPADATPISVFIAEYEGAQTDSKWGYTLASTPSGKLYVIRLDSSNNVLTYVQRVGSATGAAYAGDFLKGVTSMVLDESVPTIKTDDRLMVLQHDNGTAFVSQLDVGDKGLNDKTPGAIFGTFSPAASLYKTVWTQPAGIMNADKIAFDDLTKTLIVLDRKGITSDVIGYGLNAGGTAYDVQKFKTSIGGNNSRLTATGGKVYVGEGTTLAGNLQITSIDTATGVQAVVYDSVVGTGPKLSSVTDIRVDHFSSKLYVLDSVTNAFVAISTVAPYARTLFQSFAVSSGAGFVPNDIAYDGLGNLFVSDNNSGGIIGIGAATGARTVLRPGSLNNGQNTVAQQICYNPKQGLVSAESSMDASGVVTAKALVKTNAVTGSTSNVVPFSPTFDIDHLDIYSDTTYGEFAVSIDGTDISVTNLSTNVTQVYAQSNTYGFTPAGVTAVVMDQKSGLLYVINNETKALSSLDLKMAMAAPKFITTLPPATGVIKPTDIIVDGTNVYYLDSGTLYKVDLTATADNVKAVSNVSGTPAVPFAPGFAPVGISALGEHMEIDRNKQVMWISNKRGGAVIGVSLITGDRVVVAH